MSKTKLLKKSNLIITAIVVAVLILSSVLIYVSVTKLGGSGTTYYVSTSGDDSNNGKSPEKPWKSLDKVNSVKFKAGNTIRFKNGDSWDGFLYPQGSGKKSKPITISNYGESNSLPMINQTSSQFLASIDKAPTIKDDVLNPTVLLKNQDYWIIENLEITNTSENSNNFGILLLTTPSEDLGKNGHKNYGIEIRNCYIHDVVATNDSQKMTGGIMVLGSSWNEKGELSKQKVKPENIGFDGVNIHHNRVENVAKEGIRTTGRGRVRDSGNTNPSEYRSNYVHKNITISDNFIADIWGDGIVMSEIGENGLCERNIVRNACKELEGQKNYAGVWAWFCKDTAFRYNEVFDIAEGYNDGEAFDFDIGCENVIFEYNYSHNNAGGFLLTMTEAGGNSSNIFRHNISYNDGFGTSENNNQGIFHLGTNNVQIYNNTMYVGKQSKGSYVYLLDSDGGSGEKPVNFFKNNIIQIADGINFKLADGSRGASYSTTGVVNNIIFGAFENAVGMFPPQGYKSIDPEFLNVSEELSQGLTYDNMGKTEEEYLQKFRQRIAGFGMKETSQAKNSGIVIEQGIANIFGQVIANHMGA